MGNILSGLVLVNGTDIWTIRRVPGGRPARGHGEPDGHPDPEQGQEGYGCGHTGRARGKYSPVLTPRNEARDVTLHFALYNKTQAGWMKQYFAFVNFLKQGKDGWLEIRFPQLDLQLRVKYADCTKFTPLTYLWTEGVHAGKFRVKFREPKPII